MAKPKRSSKKNKIIGDSEIQKHSIIDNLEKPAYVLAFLVTLAILLIFLYQPLVFEGKEPAGSDIVSGIGKVQQMKIWEEKTGHFPLWNPAMFAGMPSYHRFPANTWSVDTLLNSLQVILDWRIWYFLLGALGMVLLTKYLNLPMIAGILAGIGFVLLPHFQALLIVGHSAKFRALMWMPWILLSALFFLKNRNLFSAFLFSLALALQFRTQHYQIMFYTLLLVLFLGIPQLYQLIRQHEWMKVGKVVSLVILISLITLLMVSQNLFSIKDYTPYSTRGGNAISIKPVEELQQNKTGIGFNYATNWSYSISELWNLIIPKFHGGTSNELYTGNTVPGWKNRELPTYWGTMPFTQSYEYMGILMVFLAFVGIITQWNRWEIKALTFLSMLSVLMALGKNFSILYRLFFYYVPYFDKFRVPMMILTLLMFCISLLAAFGLSSLIKFDFNNKSLLKRLYILMGILIGILVLPLIFGSSLALSQANEVQRYSQEVVLNLKKVRLDLLQKSSLTSLTFLLFGIAIIFTTIKKWFPKEIIPIGIILLVVFDFLLLDNHYIRGKFIDREAVIQQQYRETPVIRELKKDNSLFRVFPVGRLFEDTRWCYHFQSIGGYSPAKMQTIQEIIENNLFSNVGSTIPINVNILKMLNVKYLIVNQSLTLDELILKATENDRLFAYQYTGSLPRAFFVKNAIVISDGIERLKYLNHPEFDPATTAVLEKPLGEEIQYPDSSQIKVTLEPENIILEVYTNRKGLLVLSETFYPKGWRAFLDNTQELEIYKTDHLLRSIVVPVGKHTIHFTFHPKSYYTGFRISLVSSILVYGFILFFLYQKYGSLLKKRFIK